MNGHQLRLGMVAETDADRRRESEFYPTAHGVTTALLRHVHIRGRVLEPCAGAGDIAQVLRDAFYGKRSRVVTNDIDPFRQCDHTGDAASPAATCWRQPYDWVITNPPFSLAAPILKIAYEHARFGVAMLLRLSFLEPTRERGPWLAAHADQMRHVIPLNPRPSFTRDGSTDSVTVAWMVWCKNFSWGLVGGKPPWAFVMDWDKSGPHGP